MKKFLKKYKVQIILLIGLVILYLFLYKIYMPRVNAFGCFDDCNNFMGGYFLLHGKRLFSEIFFNHNPLMAYVSLLVQYVTHPQNLYELILRHRQALLLFSFIGNVLLVIRFGLPAFLFALFYELTKFYLFGDRFLAEGFIVYPLVYLLGLAWVKLQDKSLTLFDYILSGIFVWFIIFMREPYVPAALLLFGYLLWPSLSFPRTRESRSIKSQIQNRKSQIISKHKIQNTKRFVFKYLNLFGALCFEFGIFNKSNYKKLWGIGLFLILTLVTFALHDVKEFYFNVVTANIVLVGLESNDIGPKIFFYPILLFFGGEWGHFRYLIVSLNILFLVSSIILLWKKQWKIVFFMFVILGLLNIRYVVPGKVFYGAFHLLCWYGVFIFISFLMFTYVYKHNKKLFSLLSVLYAGILVFHLVAPSSFLRDKPDPHYEFITNYGGPMQVGNVVRSLSQSTDTLFLDGFDDIIYWQAKRFSQYQYSWYTSLMPYHKKYTDARIEVFRKSPPDFYYGSCPKEIREQLLLPGFIEKEYVRLYSDKKPSCLWVKKSKLKSVSKEQWKEAEMNHYYLQK